MQMAIGTYRWRYFCVIIFCNQLLQSMFARRASRRAPRGEIFFCFIKVCNHCLQSIFAIKFCNHFLQSICAINFCNQFLQNLLPERRRPNPAKPGEPRRNPAKPGENGKTRTAGLITTYESGPLSASTVWGPGPWPRAGGLSEKRPGGSVRGGRGPQ